MPAGPARTGIVFGIGAYVLWGLMPLYFRPLRGVPALEILAHRVLWSLLLLGVIVAALGRTRGVIAAARGRTLATLALTAGLIALNWYVYIWAIANDHVLEASLGYFMNPLVNVALGIVVLGERISPAGRVAVGIAAVGVLAMVATGGGAIWVSLVLATSFSLYGLFRKIVAVDALGGLTIETALLTAPAAAVLLATGPTGSFGTSAATTTLLVIAGGVTAAPLLLFAAAARRLRYATVGILQYIAPTLGFLQAVFLFGEPLRPIHIFTFGCIWIGCAIYVADAVRSARADARRIAAAAA